MGTDASLAEINERIDEFFERSKQLVGQEIVESQPWNTGVNADQSRHYLNGIGDINPRWAPNGTGTEVHPSFLTSVVYPMLHGEPMEAPLSSLIAGVEYTWEDAIEIGDDLEGTAVVKDVFEKGDPEKKRYVFIISEVTYTRNGDHVATAEGTMIRATQRGTELLEERDPPRYSESERAKIEEAYEAEIDRLSTVPATPSIEELAVGDEVPMIIRGPLTNADMVCWNAGRGPTYGATIINYKQRKGSPHNTVANPYTGWMQKTSHQHEDVWMCNQRGMPLPFANGVNMVAMTSPMVTNWMGAEGFLKRHDGKLKKPLYYGDVLRVTGGISGIDDRINQVSIDWVASNQDGEPVIEGTSDIELPGE